MASEKGMTNETTDGVADKKARPVRIENNTLIGEDAPVYTDRVSIGELLLRKLKARPDFIGQIDGITDKRSTFGEMMEKSVKCALWFQEQGIGVGDIVTVSTHNHIDAYVPLLASLYVGAVFYPWHCDADIRDVRYLISLALPKLVFISHEFVETAAMAAKAEGVEFRMVVFGQLDGYVSLDEILKSQHASRVEDFQCAQIDDPQQSTIMVCSSGTTGLPKGVMLSHAAIVNHIMYDTAFAVDDQEIVMWFNTFRWISGTIFPLQAIYLYKTRIICPSYEEEVASELIRKYNVSWTMLPTSWAVRFLKSGVINKYSYPSLRKVLIGGATLKPEIHQTIINALPHVQAVFSYGTSEVAGVCTCQRKGDKPASSGFVFKNEQMRVCDVTTGDILGPNQIGELIWKTPCMMNEYYNDPNATKKVIDTEGWFHSGDMGYFDEDGEIFVCDRIKEMIKYRGCCIFPGEVEGVLQQHPSVLEAAVVPVPSDLNDEVPMAFVSLVPGETVTEEELETLVADNLQDYKKLRGGVKFMDKLPHTSTGKIAKNELKVLAKAFEVSFEDEIRKFV